MPSKLPATSGLVDLIRKGFVAEKKFVKEYFDEARHIARTTYRIPDTHIVILVRRALKAAIRTVQLHEWQPNLIRRMVQSQVTVFRWQQGKINDEDFRKIQGPIERYVRNHLGRCVGGQLNPDQEIVCGQTIDIFLKKIKSDGFALTSGLDTYLIGIAINQIKSFGRRPLSGLANGPFTNITKPNAPTDQVMLEKVRFYRKAHRLVARQLGQLDDKCLTIILQYYGIDPTRVDAATEDAEPNEPITEAEFDSLFDVALEPAGKSRKLKDIAVELRISPKKISERHLNCVDRLVQKVIPSLLNETNAPFAEKVRQEMQLRLNEAQARKRRK